MAFWKSQRHGVVILLTFGSQFDTVKSPQILHINYERVNANWAPRGSPLGEQLLGDGPTVEAKIKSILDGRAIATRFRMIDEDPEQDSPALILTGWHSMDVDAMTLIQPSGSQPFIANGHLGAWVVGSDSSEPWRIEARDDRGRLIKTIDKDSWMS